MKDHDSRAQKKQQQIREAAKLLFLQNGFASTSIDMIKDQAGVSKQTVYVYYSSKEELLFDVINQQIFLLSDDEFSEVMQGLKFSTVKEVEESLLIFAKKLLEHFMQADYLRLARTVVAEVVQFPELAKIFREAVPLRGLRNVAKLLERADQSNFISIDQIDIAARSFVGTILTYVFVDGVLADQEVSTVLNDEQIRKIVRFYLPTILADQNQ
ncbi:TetR/AcrR family transcriptional regulator [Bacillaceae bacterium Marseille-Q3522]|nr:TetR/AcrR family transcriptional regulator [Bacillaceae bacterium Marseille-Q3522]